MAFQSSNLFSMIIYILFALIITVRVKGESSTCLTVYRDGGAPAVFQSPKCPRWKLSGYSSRRRASASNTRCQVAMLQGHRKYQEDRAFCALDIRIPFPGNAGLKEVTVGIVAVFDGHNGAEASEMASKLLIEYFILHAYFLLDSTFSVALKQFMGQLNDIGELDAFFQVINWNEDLNWQELDQDRVRSSRRTNFGHAHHLEILKEALLRAIQDIDAKFSKEAARRNLDSGSTATVILMADGKVLVANIGDSKALLCSERFQSPAEARATLLRLYREKRRGGAIISVKKNEDLELASLNGFTHFSVQELTRDHNPNREDERSRVEAAGGYILSLNGIPRVNGQLAVSRAIGDVKFKSFGVIAAPEILEWQPLNMNDSYLVAASDGIFEELSPQDVCDILWEAQTHSKTEISSSCSYSLASCIVETAFKKGSMDNVAAVVLPLESALDSDTIQDNRYTGVVDTTAVGLEYFYMQSGRGLSSDFVHLEHTHPLSTNFGRMMVKPKDGSFCCFYLAEPLSEDVDDMSEAPMLDWGEPIHDLPLALPEALDRQGVGSINIYTDQNSHMYFSLTNEQIEGRCTNLEGFSKLLALLESISFHDSNSNYGSFEHGIPDSRYVLKKRFGRGSYGEVWLAVHWNCCQESNSSKPTKQRINTSSSSNFRFDPSLRNSLNSSCTDNCSSGADEDLFILKRLMVERGRTVYLSGLREKYFGEVFLNASSSLGDQLSRGIDYSFLNESSQVTSHEEGLDHIARYVESFESQSSDIWLVFQHEGVSLSKLIYTTEQEGDKVEGSEQVKHSQVLHPSKWWNWLKTTKAGKEEMCSIIWQLLMALKSCHDRNITHRDIKPENMVICFEDHATGKCLRGSPIQERNYTTKMRLIDFGSAIDEFTLKHIYGSTGPSRAEQTSEYAPPEALLNSTWYHAPTSTVLKYDMWSVGVVILELILGSPNVFQISPFTTALLDQHLEGWDEGLKELAYRLRAFMEMCILIPDSSSKHRFGATIYGNGVSPASWKCSEEFFARHIKSRDLLNLGFPDISALRLVRHLLLWDPDDRLSIDEAMQHPYFESLKK
ncbi:hypothetical protein SAY87_000811 [Trapa incisa]|uniref:Protein-serine/threonine phosphatase n=1 Tax=Trapa incisa TaxID=236973 RepID=A0AAN7JH82_9MYRT|nr:hypothetical protein SAY87_000811 [Trapa incisa]